MTTPADIEPTAFDLILDSVAKIATAHQNEIDKGWYKSTAEWTALHHDLWASYATYLYDQQMHGECPECLYLYDDPDEGCDACVDKKVTP